jgi:hypothetical protein
MVEVSPRRPAARVGLAQWRVPTLPVPISTLPSATWRPLTRDDAAARVRLHEEARLADAADGGADSATGYQSHH